MVSDWMVSTLDMECDFERRLHSVRLELKYVLYSTVMVHNRKAILFLFMATNLNVVEDWGTIQRAGNGTDANFQ